MSFAEIRADYFPYAAPAGSTVRAVDEESFWDVAGQLTVSKEIITGLALLLMCNRCCTLLDYLKHTLLC